MTSNKSILVLLLLLAGAVIGAGVWLTLDSGTPAEELEGVDGASLEEDDEKVVIDSSPDGEVGEREAITKANTNEDSTPTAILPSDATESESTLGLKGRVIDEAGNPVADAVIHVHKKSGYNFFGRPSEKKSDENGNFEYGGLDPKTPYSVRVSHPEYVDGSAEAATLDDGWQEIEPVVMTLGGSVEGSVYGPSGAPIEGATVWARKDRSKSKGALSIEEFNEFLSLGEKSVSTDASGHFRLAGLPPGRAHEICAKATECDQGTVGPFEIKKGEVRRGIVFNLEPGKMIGGVVMSEGRPVEGAEVKLRSWGGFFDGHKGVKAPEPKATDGQGRFMFTSVAKGNYSLTINASGYAEERLNSVKPGANDLVVDMKRYGGVRGIVRAGDQPITKFDLKASKKRSSGRQGRFEDVTDQDGSDNETFHVNDLAPGAYIVSVSAEGFAKGKSTTFDVVAGKTTEDILISLEPEASLSGRVVSEETGEPIAGAKVSAQVEGNEDPRSLEFEAAFATADSPMPFMHSRRQSNRATTDEEGQFRLGQLDTGSYKVRVSHEDYVVSEDGPYELTTGQAHDPIELSMITGGTITGSVVDREGNPRAGDSIVAVADGEGKKSKSAQTDTDGVYRIEHLEPGTYRVVRRHRSNEGGLSFVGADTMIVTGGGPGSENKTGQIVVVENGKEAVCNLNDNDLGFLSGRVSFQGVGVSDAKVELRKENAFGPSHSVKTESNGRYQIEGIGPGNYRFQVKHPQAVVPHGEDMEITQGDITHDVRLAGGIVRGTITDLEEGKGMAAVNVSLKAEKEEVSHSFYSSVLLSDDGGEEISMIAGPGGALGTVTTDEKGRYEIPFVPPGNYKLVVTHQSAVVTEDVSVELERDQVKDGIDAQMTTGGTLTGSIKNASGSTVRQAWVFLREKGGSGTYNAGVNEEGVYEIKGIKAGTYTLRADSYTTNGSADEEEVTIAIGEKVIRDLTLRKKQGP